MKETSHPEMERLEAAAFRRLLDHLRMRQDVANVTLMGEAGFCRNCLADWLAEASIETSTPLTREEARNHIYKEPYADFKARQLEATPEQLARMDASLAENERRRRELGLKLDEQLEDTFPASDPPSITGPQGED